MKYLKKYEKFSEKEIERLRSKSDFDMDKPLNNFIKYNIGNIRIELDKIDWDFTYIEKNEVEFTNSFLHFMYNKNEDVALYINYIENDEGAKRPYHFTYEIYSPKYRFDFISKKDDMLSLNEIFKVLKNIEWLYENNFTFQIFEENNIELPKEKYIEDLPEYIEKIEDMKKKYDYFFNAKDMGLL